MEIGARVLSIALFALAAGFVAAHPMHVGVDASWPDALVAGIVAVMCAAICGAALRRFARDDERSATPGA